MEQDLGKPCTMSSWFANLVQGWLWSSAFSPIRGRHRLMPGNCSLKWSSRHTVQITRSKWINYLAYEVLARRACFPIERDNVEQRNARAHMCGIGPYYVSKYSGLGVLHLERLGAALDNFNPTIRTSNQVSLHLRLSILLRSAPCIAGHLNTARGMEEEAAMPSSPQSVHVSVAELGCHNKKGDCWLAVHRKVWELTDFVDKHPGGAESKPWLWCSVVKPFS